MIKKVFICMGLVSHFAYAAFALEFQQIPIYNFSSESKNADAWKFDGVVKTSLLPMSEQVADVLATLDPSKKFLCEAKVLTIGTGAEVTNGIKPVYELRNCIAKDSL